MFYCCLIVFVAAASGDADKDKETLKPDKDQEVSV